MARLRRVLLDVDKPIKEPSMFALVNALSDVKGVTAVNATVDEMDVDVMGMIISIEGDGFSFASLEQVIDGSGAVIHSVDQIVAGDHLIELLPNRRLLT